MRRPFTVLLSLAVLTAGKLAAGEAADAAAIRREAVQQHAKMVYAIYLDSVTEAKKMQTAVRNFLAAPDQTKLEAARAAWIAARRPYLQSETCRFYAGPIDDPDGPEPLLNAWPLDENFIEAPPGSPDPGIVGNTRDYPHLTPSLLVKLNQQDGERNVASGWHAVEFLLWGPDRSATGPGERPVSDYVSAPHAKRRGEYLQACADLIVQHLEELVRDWEPEDPKNYRANYRAVFEEGVDYSLQRMISAMIFLSENELAGERLQVAWDTKDQENEHSCFSDTTWQDNVMDATALLNVWRGEYVKGDGTKLEGRGLRDVCRVVQPDMEQKLTELIEANVAKARAIPQPFDQAILGEDDATGRKAVMALIASLEDTGAELRKLAQAMGVEVPEVPPEDIEG
jgi:putative iron-regulated protein